MLGNYRGLFGNRDYASLWTGQTTSVFGDAVYQVAFNWYVYKTSPSAFIAGFVIFCAAAPHLLFGLVGGVYADRLSRRHIMIACDVVRAATVAIVPILSLFSISSLPVVTAVAVILASARCFFYPASKSAVADMLTDDAERQAGSSFLQASFHAASVAGVALGGVMIGLCSAPLMYFTPVICYAISIVSLLRIKSIPAGSATEAESGLIGEIIDTIKYVRTMRDLCWALALFGVGLLVIGGIEQVALPALSDNIWQVGPSGLGFMLGAFAIGNVVGSLIFGKLKISHFALVIFSGWALCGLFFALVGASPVFALALSFALMAGSAEAMSDIPMVLLIQLSVPRERMGKVFSLWSTVVFIAEAGSALVGGVAVGKLGAAPACCAAGIALALIAIVGLLLTRPTSTAPAVERPLYA
jgi:MFS transporter, DHA3 family, macrolide efflux protein